MIRYGYMHSENPKTHQRAMNRLVRLINKNIKNDSLWQGRFVVRQIESHWIKYEHGWGGELCVRLELRDTKTGWTCKSKYRTVNEWRFINGHRLWEFANDAIISCRAKFGF